MSLRWSPLHAALGLLPQPLEWGHIEQLVERQVPEDTALDWKRAVPVGDAQALDEFAKDVAALANSGGGCLVFGVAEQRGRGTAAAISPVDVSEGVQQRLRAAAASRIRPLVGASTSQSCEPTRPTLLACSWSRSLPAQMPPTALRLRVVLRSRTGTAAPPVG